MKLLGLILCLFVLPAAAEPGGAPLAAALGVQIQKPVGDNLHFAHGSGVFLGGGLILTAAHVVKYNPQDPTVTVIMDGWKNAARIAAIAPNGLDLALLKVDPGEISAQRRAMSPVQLCPAPTVARQPVIVAADGAVTLSVTADAPLNSPAMTGDWTDILLTGYEQGASGGGIFDSDKGCLIGIIIIEGRSEAVKLTKFIPAAKIAPFLAAAITN